MKNRHDLQNGLTLFSSEIKKDFLIIHVLGITRISVVLTLFVLLLFRTNISLAQCTVSETCTPTCATWTYPGDFPTDQQASVNLDQGANDKLATPMPVDFQNGNLNVNNSHFIEGQSVPYRAILTKYTNM